MISLGVDAFPTHLNPKIDVLTIQRFFLVISIAGIEESESTSLLWKTVTSRYPHGNYNAREPP